MLREQSRTVISQTQYTSRSTLSLCFHWPASTSVPKVIEAVKIDFATEFQIVENVLQN